MCRNVCQYSSITNEFLLTNILHYKCIVEYVFYSLVWYSYACNQNLCVGISISIGIKANTEYEMQFYSQRCALLLRGNILF